MLEFLQGEGQAIWTVLRFLLPQLVTWLRLPLVDNLLNMLEGGTDLDVPRLDMGQGVEFCPQLPVTRPQRVLLRLDGKGAHPVRRNGDEVHGGYQPGSLYWECGEGTAPLVVLMLYTSS